MRRLTYLTLLMALITANCFGDDHQAQSEQAQRWEIGLLVTASAGPAAGIQAAFPIPTAWPEQQVRIVEKRASAEVRQISTRQVKGGATQMVATIPRLRQGETAEALVVFEIVKTPLHAPSETDDLTAPRARSRELRPYLQPSPLIESDDPKIVALAARIVEGKENDWEQVEAIYDWVQANIRYVNGPLKGAAAALRDGDGDCEEMTSLFIALCRASHVPARTVWVPGHCYPEFYLEKSSGEGLWLPCQAAGDRQFGSMDEGRPIFQKGDNFVVPGQRKPSRYANAVAISANRRGLASPQLKMVVRRLE